MKLEDLEWSEEDAVLGKFAFEFKHEGELAIASIIFICMTVILYQS